MKFAGVDLSWKCAPYLQNATAVCVCDGNGMFNDPVLATSDDDIVDLLTSNDVDMVAIDASLRVPNEKGMRSVEKEAARSGIRILPTNRTFLDRTCGGSRGEQLVTRLEAQGYVLAGKNDLDGKLIFETYPFGVMHAIFGGHVPRYKKGPLAARRDACAEITRAIRSWGPKLDLPARLQDDIASSTTSDIKSIGDRIDALVCACCLYAHWSYRGKRTKMLGDEIDGYLLLV
ncbi:MAG TPA: DUF429 domain-containing protein [Methanomassiliicoccales archaeon]|nr:DUF429 domain-containing protein [Methanomassiliicoccales archaeon]